MEVLDDEGRLFGLVNVIDALVVLFAVAVVVAGAALVFGGGLESDSGDTLHVTLVSENASATAFAPGNVTLEDGTLGGAGRDATATVTAVHRTAGPRVYLGVALEGTRTDEGFRFGNEPVRVGDRVVVATDTARAEARLIERNAPSTFSTSTTAVTVESTVRRPVADAVSAGDQHRVGGTTVATVRRAETTALNDSHARLRVSLDLRTRDVDGTPRYGGRPVRLGRTVRFETTDYEFAGPIVDRG